MLRINKKRGISIVVLVLTIILLLILSTALVISIGDNAENAKLSQFVNEISQLQDAVDSYYIMNNSIPTNEEELTLDEVKNLIDSKYVTDFEEELSLNLDTTAKFYKIDFSLIEIQNIDEIDMDKKAFVVSYPNLNVYALKATEVKGVGYFSLTSKVRDIVEYNKNNSISNSKTNIVDGIGLVVSSDTSKYTNKLGIKVNISNLVEETDSVYLEISGIDLQKKVSTSVATSFSFDTLEELVSKSILEDTLSNLDISAFNNSNSKSINIVVKRNDKEIARENLDMSNYEIIKPIISLNKNKKYEEMRVLRINTSDTNSGIKEIRYDYLKKLDASNNRVYNYDGVTSFDETYMREKSKVISLENTFDEFVDIKIPSNIVTVCVVAIDNAGNISDILSIDVQ